MIVIALEYTWQISRWPFSFIHSVCVCESLSHVWLFVTPWTASHQVHLSMKFSRPEYWGGQPFPSPGDRSNPGIEPESPWLQADSFPSEPPGKTYPQGPEDNYIPKFQVTFTKLTSLINIFVPSPFIKTWFHDSKIPPPPLPTFPR